MTEYDYIDWRGGDCPVDANARVDVLFRDGIEEHDMPARSWSGEGGPDLWRHAGYSGGHIIGYRVTAL